MAKNSKPFYKSWSFWLLTLTLLLIIWFIWFGGESLHESLHDFSKRVLYGGIFFATILIMNLSYLLFTKEENRRKREERNLEFIRSKKEKLERRKEEKVVVTQLREKFYNAKRIIKKSSIYKMGAFSNYDLPWYLVVGEEKSKKASILRHSGLDFPVNINYKDSESKENQDDMTSFRWFFSEESVFINIPSAYVSTDTDRLERTVWDEFLRLFKKERWQRPVNGIILTLRAEQFLGNEGEKIDEYAKVLRTRFDEISKAFFSDIPIYVVISGLESLTGFREYFHTLTNEEKKEILGVTFEERLLNINRDTISINFSKLQEKLEGDRIDKLHREWSTSSRANAYFFNDEFRALLDKITEFSGYIFSKTRYHAPLMLRGIYFTSIDYKNVESQSREGVTGNLNDIPKGIFLPKVFEKVILSESNLVKIDKKFRKKYTIIQSALMALLFFVVVGSTTYWAMFINQENQEVRKVEDTIIHFNKIKESPLPSVVLTREGRKEKSPSQFQQIGQLGGVSGSNNLNFLSNKFELTDFAKRELISIAKKIKTFDATTRIKIIGYTDNVGDEDKNLILSQERANSIRDYFVSLGIERIRMETIGRGSSNAVASNDTPEGRSLNRRVEVFAYGLAEYEKRDPMYKENYSIKIRPEEWREVISTLETLCDVGADDKNSTIAMEIWKPGFYRIADRGEWVTKLYHQTLNTILLDRVAILIEKELLNSIADVNDFSNTNNIDEINRIRAGLKAYLLLANKKRRDLEPDYLKQYMLHRWGNLDEESIEKLNRHFERLLSIEMRDVQLNQKTIDRARSAIKMGKTDAELYYETLKEVTSNMNLKEFRFNQELAANPNSIKGGDYMIPAIYTKKGYEETISIRSKEILKEAIEVNWILGEEDGYSRSEFKYLHKQVLNLYFSDYRKVWNKALSKLTIPKYVDSKDLAEQLALYSSPSSPIIDVLRALKKNTLIYTLQEKAKIARDKDKTGLSAKLGKIGRVVNSVDDPHKQYKLDLRNFFKGYHQLLDKSNFPSRKLIPFQKRLRDVYEQMLMVESSTEPKKIAYDIVNKNSSEAHVGFDMKHTFIPIPVSNWYNQMLKQNWKQLTDMVKGHINKEFIDEIWDDYDSKIANRFPLNPESPDDIEMDDFIEFFGKGGVMDGFYKKYLFPFIDVNYRDRTYKVKKVDEESVAIDKKLVESMWLTKDIRDLLFDEGGSELKIEFKVKPIKLEKTLATMELQYEDQLLMYEHGPKLDQLFVAPGARKNSLAKFTLYDFDLKRVVKLRGRGEWAMLRVLYMLNPKITGDSRDGVGVTLSYNQGNYSGELYLQGKSSKIFSQENPLKLFKLER